MLFSLKTDRGVWKSKRAINTCLSLSRFEEVSLQSFIYLTGVSEAVASTAEEGNKTLIHFLLVV